MPLPHYAIDKSHIKNYEHYEDTNDNIFYSRIADV